MYRPLYQSVVLFSALENTNVLNSAMAQTIFGVNALKENIPVYVMSKFDFIQMLEYTQKYRITFLILVPPVVVAMAKHPITKKFDLSSVEHVGSGAAPLGREVCVELEKLWPENRINVKQGWGMTEITCSALGWHPEEYSDSFSVGELNANCEAKIMDDDGLKEVLQGERGEIWVKAPNVMKGYWNRPDATRETLTPDGWLKTGDIAYVDRNGKFFIVDRKKELIKVKGNQVAPAELEALLLDHDAIADVAVIGVTIAHDEHPRAYVVLKEGAKVTEKDVQDWLSKLVTRTKRLTGGVRFVDAIPKNPVRYSDPSDSHLEHTNLISLAKYFERSYETRLKRNRRMLPHQKQDFEVLTSMDGLPICQDHACV